MPTKINRLINDLKEFNNVKNKVTSIETQWITTVALMN